MKTAIFVLSLVLISSCTDRSQNSQKKVSNLSKSEVKVLIGNHVLMKPRGLCNIYQKASFGGQYLLDKMITNMEPDEFGGELPYTSLFFLREVKFGDAPDRFEVKVLGGENDKGIIVTSMLSMKLGESYILFPTKRKGVFSISPDSKFVADTNGNFRNGYLLNRAPISLNAASFKQHYLNETCVEVRPDGEYSVVAPRKGRSDTTKEVGE